MDNHNIKCCACKCVCVCVRVGTSTKCNTKFSSNQKRKKINASQPAANNEHSMLSFCCCWCAFRRSERRRWIRWRFCYELLSFLIPLCFFFRPIGKSATDCARLIFNLDPSPTHWLLNIRGTNTVRMWAPGSKKVTWKHSRKCTFFLLTFCGGSDGGGHFRCQSSAEYEPVSPAGGAAKRRKKRRFPQWAHSTPGPEGSLPDFLTSADLGQHSDVWHGPPSRCWPNSAMCPPGYRRRRFSGWRAV